LLDAFEENELKLQVHKRPFSGPIHTLEELFHYRKYFSCIRGSGIYFYYYRKFESTAYHVSSLLAVYPTRVTSSKRVGLEVTFKSYVVMAVIHIYGLNVIGFGNVIGGKCLRWPPCVKFAAENLKNIT
jgi:hypothetical protein